MTAKKIPYILPMVAMVCALISGIGGAEAKKRSQLEPSYAWKLVPPLGLREPATIDTLYQNYSLEFIPQNVSYAYAATGNYCAEGRQMLYDEREPMSEFFFHDAVRHWLPAEGKMKFYNTRIPMTLLSYNFGGGKENSQDHFQTIFTANANARTQVGALIDYLYSKGCYANQAAKDLTWGFSASYIGERYEVQSYFYHFNLLGQENGGIIDERYITDPAIVQGGNTSINAKDIPTNLTQATNRTKGTEFYFNGRYKLGFWKEEQVDDTTTTRTLVPVTSLIWTLKYQDGDHTFRNVNATENLEFWDHTYFSPNYTRDNQTYWKVRNTLGISLLEGFNKYAKAGLAAYLTHEARRYSMFTDIAEPNESQAETMTADPHPDMMCAQTQQLMWVGAQLTKQQGRIINYDVTGEIGLIGDAAGEVKVEGNLTTRIPLLGDTVPVHAYGHFRNTTAPWLMQHLKTNHFVWDNDFSKTRSVKIGGDIAIPWTRTRASVSVENVQNLIYFDENALPAQAGSNVQIFSVNLQQNFAVRALHWDNTITYQTSTQESVVPLPKLALHSNLYLLFKVATLHVQLGVDCDYFTRYRALGFQPETMSFYNQQKTLVGNYPFMNAYVNCKLSKVRFYVMMSHVNQGLFGGAKYFSMPDYPMNPRRFQLGLSIDFAN